MRRRSRRKHGSSNGSSGYSSGKSERSSSKHKNTEKNSAIGKAEAENPEGGKKKESNNEQLMVVLRVRPLKREEESKGYQSIAEKVDEKMVVLSEPKNRKQDVLRKNRNPERQYIFDKAFGPDASQEEIYSATTKKLVENVLQGYNATVFAYGATGGGKTYTMVGTRDNPGIMVRALNHLFTEVENDKESAHKVTMSYLEIYNECIRDLLEPESGFLELREDSKGRNIQVAGLSERATKNADDVMKLLQKGNKERTQEPTAANKTSSRSHALLMVNVKQTAKLRTNTHQAVKHGRLYMIDLAGSERASNTQNKGIRLKEGAHINRSLLALGNCINALAEGKAKYVNYRDSKLTRLLKDALSGNCHTVMIAHISPADKHWEESRNTLVYADRAKNISNKVRRNVLDVSYHVSQYQGIIKDLKGEIGRLKEKIDNEPSHPGSTVTKQQMAELKELRDEMVANFREQMSLRHRLMEIDNHILSLSMEFEKQNIIVTEWETEKAKDKSDKLYEKRKQKKVRLNNPKIYLEPGTADHSSSEVQQEESEDVESGFEDNFRILSDSDETDDENEKKSANKKNVESSRQKSADNNDGRESSNGKPKSAGSRYGKESPEAESGPSGGYSFSLDEAKDTTEDREETDDGDYDEQGSGSEEKAVQIIYNNSDSEQESDVYEEDEPEEVKRAWEELVLIQREQQRYSDIKQDLEEELEGLRDESVQLENELPTKISTSEEKEILSLLCKVHELEIDKVEMKSEGLLKEHEVRRRDLLILKYDKQRNLCDEIILRQQKLIEALDQSKLQKSMGGTMPMPPELMELYNLYQQELNTRRSEKESKYMSELNVMLRSPSMLSLRGPEFDEKPQREGKLPPIKQEEERLFQSRRRGSTVYDTEDDYRADSRMSVMSSDGSRLPSIDTERDDSARTTSSESDGRRRHRRRRKSNAHQTLYDSEPNLRSARKSVQRENSVHFPPIESMY